MMTLLTMTETTIFIINDDDGGHAHSDGGDDEGNAHPPCVQDPIHRAKGNKAGEDKPLVRLVRRPQGPHPESKPREWRQEVRRPRGSVVPCVRLPLIPLVPLVRLPLVRGMVVEHHLTTT